MVLVVLMLYDICRCQAQEFLVHQDFDLKSHSEKFRNYLRYNVALSIGNLPYLLAKTHQKAMLI